MTRMMEMNLEEAYPRIFERLEEKDLELRHLLNVDENELDYDSEEFEFEPEEFNYIIYIAEPIQKLFSEEQMYALIQKLGDNKEVFEHFFASEIDLYGVKSVQNQEEIIKFVLESVEEML